MRKAQYTHINGNIYRLTTGKKGAQLASGAQYVKGRTLSDVYSTYSRYKAAAYNDCLSECQERNGENFRIISANSNFFSVAYECIDDMTGEIITVIHTGRNDYYVSFAG